MKIILRPLVIVLSLATLLGLSPARPDCQAAPPVTAGKRPTEARPISVLIVGNSYVYKNDLPRMLAEVARTGGRAIEIDSVTGGGLTLKDHVQQGRAAERIRSRPWDYVVLQGQSQEVLKDPATMREAAKSLTAEIHRAGAKTLLFVTWARKDESDTQPFITKTYDALARDLGAEMIPVGPAFIAAQASESGPRLYDGDGSHPSRLGTYLTACAFYGSIYDDSPVGLPVRLFGVTDKEVLTVQATAWSAVKIVKDAKRAGEKLTDEAKRNASLIPGGKNSQLTPSGRRKPLIIDNTQPAQEAAPDAQAPPASAQTGPVPAPATPLPLK